MGKGGKRASFSMSDAMTIVVVVIVSFSVIISLVVFNAVFSRSMQSSAITTSEQSVDQVAVTINNYTDDMLQIMDRLYVNSITDPASQEELFEDLIDIRSDVVMITTYDIHGNNTGIWSRYDTKDLIYTNLSYISISDEGAGGLGISAPHVVSVLDNNYPWVVTITRNTTDGSYSNAAKIAIDVKFSGIARYIDEVGIGSHGYCFIMDDDGNIVYHPQQQLIYAGLKDENEEIRYMSDGSHMSDGVIYTIKTLNNSNWKIVGVTYEDETVNTRVNYMITVSFLILFTAVIVSFLSGRLFSHLFTKPASSATACGA